MFSKDIILHVCTNGKTNFFTECSEYSKGTWKYLEKLWKSPVGGKLGVSLVPCLNTSDTEMPVPSYSDFVYGFQTVSKEELAIYNNPELKYVFGIDASGKSVYTQY